MITRLALLALALAACGGSSSPGLNDDPPPVNDDPPVVNTPPSPMDEPDEEPSPVDEPDGPVVSTPAPSDTPDAGAPDRDSGGELPVPQGSDGGAEPLGEIGEPCVEGLDCSSQWCSVAGVCVEPPPRDIALGETCHDDLECASEYCDPREYLFGSTARLLTGWCEERPAIAAGWHDCQWQSGECVR